MTARCNTNPRTSARSGAVRRSEIVVGSPHSERSSGCSGCGRQAGRGLSPSFPSDSGESPGAALGSATMLLSSSASAATIAFALISTQSGAAAVVLGIAEPG